jgi:ABC-type antimicrobial peptide transport system permease subunit
VLWTIRLWLRMTVLMSGVAMVLSLAGIYAVLSFAVSCRTREIGVRVALGATRRRVIAAIFREPLVHVATGIVAGASIIFTVGTLAKHTEFPGSESGLSGAAVALLAAHASVVLGICLLASVVPIRRALGVEPTVALRAD